MSIFRQSEGMRVARRTCRYCPAPAEPGEDVCAAHAGEAGRLLRDPRRAGYRSPQYRIARRAAIARSGGRCESCGAELPRRPNGSVICQTHHRHGDPTFNPPDGSELTVCCEDCHSGRRRPD